MRSIVPNYSDGLKITSNDKKLSQSYLEDGYRVNKYRALVKKVAELCYWNKDYLAFFRGQNFDYKNKGGNSTFYPTIYRDDPLTEKEKRYLFEKLDSASGALKDELQNRSISGWKEVNRWKEMQWALLQHYEVTPTPLIDVTQSLRVACSFGQHENNNDDAYVYVFGLPYPNSRITHNSEDELLYVRLLGISPSIALRPLYQEGYLVGTDGITTEYHRKTKLDLNNRLIAKFIIPNNKSFWDDGFTTIPKEALYPVDDEMKDICDGIKDNLTKCLINVDVGQFLNQWNKIEKMIHGFQKRQYGEYSPNLYTSMRRIAEEEPDFRPFFSILNNWRNRRNQIVHGYGTDSFDGSRIEMDNLNELTEKLEKTLSNIESSNQGGNIGKKEIERKKT